MIPILSDVRIKELGLVTYDAKGDIDDADISGIAKAQRLADLRWFVGLAENLEHPMKDSSSIRTEVRRLIDDLKKLAELEG